MFTDPTGMSKDGIENEYTRYIKNGVVQEVKQTGTDGGDIFDRITDVDMDKPMMEAGTTFVVPVERSESTVSTNLRSQDGASAGTYRGPGFRHDYKYKAQSQAIEPMGFDSPFFVVGGVASKLVGRSSATKTSTRFVSTAEGVVHDLKPTLDRIASGGKFPHRNDGSIFKNMEGLLPKQNAGYYREFVHPTPGVNGPGAMRVVTGQNGQMWFTPDHYKTFIPIR